MNISIYKNVKQTVSNEFTTIPEFLSDIKEGKWQDIVLNIRTIQDKEIRRVEKTKLPNVTISGVFGKRLDTDCKSASGFIAVDLDNLGGEVESTRVLLESDPYVYSIFTSVSGSGLCVLFKIDPEQHRRSFEGIADYLIKKYQLLADSSGVNESRARFVSYDPDLFIRESALKFKKYLPKPKKRTTITSVFVHSEFEEIVAKMVQQGVSCVEDYRDWRDIGFGLADQFGEAGRPYFHSLSSVSSKYDPSLCDKQFTQSLLRNGRPGNKITIATIYWYAKQAGIQIQSERTKKIITTTNTLKKTGAEPKDISNTLKKEGIEGVDDIIKQAFSVNEIPTALIESIRIHLKHTYSLKRNLITRKLENNGKILDEIDLNTMFLDCMVQYDKLNFELFLRIILSSNTEQYNPVKDFIELQQWDERPRIEQLAKCINSNTGDLEWREKMLTKWLVGIVHSVMGGKNELNFILVGGKNTGKTEFFRQLLPIELRNYFAESQLNRGKDDEILMCERLIIFNDEYGGKNRADERNEKRLMASDEFSLREPYGKTNVTLKRIASLCGTCNELDVLDDPTGNRRIIVMASAGKFDYELYNSLDKAQILAEAYCLWKDGERPILQDVDIACLEEVTDGEYSKVSFEEEMVQRWFLTPERSTDFLTTSEIKVELEGKTKERININKLGARLRKLGYKREKQIGRYGYIISKIPLEFTGYLPVT